MNAASSSSPRCAGTSAWNICVSGRKRWCMLAPETDLASLGLGCFERGKHPMASTWCVCVFVDARPALRRAAKRPFHRSGSRGHAVALGSSTSCRTWALHCRSSAGRS